MCLGLDEVADGFGLSKVEAPVGDGPHSEFARVRGPCAQIKQAIENTQKQGRGTVATKLHDIVARIGMRRFEEGNYNPINNFESIRVEDGL